MGTGNWGRSLDSHRFREGIGSDADTGDGGTR